MPAIRDWIPAWTKIKLRFSVLALSGLDVHLVVGDGLPLGLEVVIAAGLVNTQRGVKGLEGEVLILLLPGHAGVDGVQIGGVFRVHGGAHETNPGEIELAEARAGYVTSIAHRWPRASCHVSSLVFITYKYVSVRLVNSSLH